jgi:hypothetical protein
MSDAGDGSLFFYGFAGSPSTLGGGRQQVLRQLIPCRDPLYADLRGSPSPAAASLGRCQDPEEARKAATAVTSVLGDLDPDASLSLAGFVEAEAALGASAKPDRASGCPHPRPCQAAPPQTEHGRPSWRPLTTE